MNTLDGRRTSYTVLDRRVLAVAVEGHADDWAAYIGPVEGECHDKEWYDVYRYGSKLRREIAELLFPSFTDRRYRGC